MPSTYSPNLHLELQATGENTNVWGQELNNNVFTTVDSVLGSTLSLPLVSTDVTLTTVQTQNNFIDLSGIITANINIIFPAIGRTFYVRNGTTGNFTVTLKTVAAGAVFVIPQGTSAFIVLNGVDVLTPQASTGAHNFVYNGSFRLNQRGFTGGALAAGVYGFDRWKAGSGGCTFTVAGTISNGIATITAGTLLQIIPAEDIEVTGTYTISWSGSSPCTVNGVAVTNGSNVTLPGNTNVFLTFGVGNLTSVQLGFGPSVTPFERRQLGLELELCQRFYEKSYELTSAPGSNQGAAVVGAFASVALNVGDFYNWGEVRFKTRKFADPFINTWAMNGASGVFFNVSTATNQGNVGSSNSSQTGFRLFCANNVLTANNVFAAHWSAESEI